MINENEKKTHAKTHLSITMLDNAIGTYLSCVGTKCVLGAMWASSECSGESGVWDFWGLELRQLKVYD